MKRKDLYVEIYNTVLTEVHIADTEPTEISVRILNIMQRKNTRIRTRAGSVIWRE